MKKLLELLSENNLSYARLEALFAHPKDTPFSADEETLIAKIKDFEKELRVAFAATNAVTIYDVLAFFPTDDAAYPNKCLSKLRLIQTCLQDNSLPDFQLFYKAVYKKYLAKVFQEYLKVVHNNPANSVVVRDKTHSLLESLKVLARRKDNNTESNEIPDPYTFSTLINEHLPISSEVYAANDLLVKLNYIQTNVVPKTNLHERLFADFIAQVTSKKGEANDLASAYGDIVAAFNSENFNAAIPELLKFASVIDKQHLGMPSEAILKSLADNAAYKCHELPNLLIYAAIHKVHHKLSENSLAKADRAQLKQIKKALQYLQILLGSARVEEKAGQIQVSASSQQKARIVLTTETKRLALVSSEKKGIEKDEIEPIESRNKSTAENPRQRFSDRKSKMIDLLEHLKNLDKETLLTFFAGKTNNHNEFNEVIKFIKKSYGYLSELAPTFIDLTQSITWESLLPPNSSLVNIDLLEKLDLIQNISVRFNIELQYSHFYDSSTHHLSLTSKDDRNLEELTHAVENKLGLQERVKNKAKQQLPVVQLEPINDSNKKVLSFSDIPTTTSILPSKNAARHIPISELELAANDFTQKTLARRASLKVAKREETDTQMIRNSKEIVLISRIKKLITEIKSLPAPKSDKDLETYENIKMENIATLLAVFNLDLKAIHLNEEYSQTYIDAYLNLYTAFADIIPNLAIYRGLLTIFAALKQNNIESILKALVEFGELMESDFAKNETNARFIKRLQEDTSKRWPIGSLDLHAAMRTAIAQLKEKELSEDEAKTVKLMEVGFAQFEKFAKSHEVAESKKIEADEPQVKMVLDCALNDVLPEQKLQAILTANTDCKNYLGNFIVNRIGELGGNIQDAEVPNGENSTVQIPVQAIVASAFDPKSAEEFKFASVYLKNRREEIKKLVEKDSTLYVAIQKYNAVLALDDTLKSDKTVKEKLDTYSATFKAKEPTLNKKMDSDDTLWKRLMNKLRNLVSSIAPKYVEAPVTVKEANLVAKMHQVHTLFCRRQNASPRSPIGQQRLRAH